MAHDTTGGEQQAGNSRRGGGHDRDRANDSWGLEGGTAHALGQELAYCVPSSSLRNAELTKHAAQNAE